MSAAVTATAGAWLAGWIGAATAGAAGALVAGAVLSRRGTLERSYRAWSRAERRLGSLASRALLAAAFRVVLRTAACAGRPISLEHPEGDWTFWALHPRDVNTGLPSSLPAAESDGWIRRYLRWATARSERVWMIGLLPFLALLRLLSRPEAQEIPSETYTLY